MSNKGILQKEDNSKHIHPIKEEDNSDNDGPTVVNEAIPKTEFIDCKINEKDPIDATFKSDDMDTIKQGDNSDNDGPTVLNEAIPKTEFIDRKINEKDPIDGTFKSDDIIQPITHGQKNAIKTEVDGDGNVFTIIEYAPESCETNILFNSDSADSHQLEKEELGPNSDEEEFISVVEIYKTEYIDDDDSIATTSKNITNNLKNVVCDICNKTFPRQLNLKRHYRLHTGERRHQCSLCKKGYQNKADLHKHQRNVHNATFGKNGQVIVEPFHKEIFKFQREPFTQQDIHGEEKPTTSTLFLLHAENKCAICAKEFDKRTDFIEHAKQMHPNEKAFKCTNCSSQFANMESIHSHFRKDHIKDIVCTFCLKSFPTKADLKRHSVVHTGQRPFSCLLCEKSYKYELSLKYHVKNQHDKESKDQGYITEISKDDGNDHNKTNSLLTDNKCVKISHEINMKMFNGSQDLMNHAKEIHSDEKQFKCCEICNKTFSRNHDWKRHLKTHTDVTFQCSLCEKAYKHKIHLSKHRQNVHNETSEIMDPDEWQLKCSICSETFSKKKRLTHHIRTMHTKENVCELCEKTFANNSELNRHLKVHSEDRPFQCSLCKKSFKHNWDFFKHQKIVHNQTSEKIDQDIRKSFHEEEFNGSQDLMNHAKEIHSDKKQFKCCEICNKTFSYNYDWKRHLKAHTDERPFQCSLCEKAYKHKIDLSKHRQNVHNETSEIMDPDEWKWQCSTCSEKFSRKKRLTNHIRMMHTKEIVCEICNKTFARNYELNRHLKVHTEDPPFHQKIVHNETSEKIDQDIRKSFHEEESNKHEDLVNNLKIHDIELVEDIKMPKIESVGKIFKMEFKGPMLKPLLIENKCDICNKIFKFQRDLIRHVEFYHRNRKAFKCRHCTTRFYDARATASTQRSRRNRKSATKQHVCKICSKKFHHICHLKSHLKQHNTQQNIHEEQGPATSAQVLFYAENKCAICAKVFLKESEFVNHAKQFHPNEKVFKCPHCGARFRNIRSVGIHAKKSHKMKSKLLHVDSKCAICNMEFDRRSVLVEHAKQMHPNEKALKCSDCSLQFPNLKTIRTHFRRAHIKDICCSFCFKSFSTKAELKRHLVIHTRQRPFSCLRCKKSFEHEFILKMHVKKAHYKESKKQKYTTKISKGDDSKGDDVKKPLSTENKCRVCYEEFNRPQDLLNHLKESHPNEKRFKCSTCSEQFANKKGLTSHIRVTHTKDLICEICEKAFAHQFQLERHLNSHTKSKCSTCSEQFATRVKLLKHITMKHTKELACKICKKSFSRKCDLQRHLILHTKDRPFQCSLCEKKFKYKSNLSKHQRMIHNIKEILHAVEFNKQQDLLEDFKMPKIVSKIEIVGKIFKMEFKGSVLNALLTENKCAICNKIFKFQRDLIRHVEFYHRNGRAFKCRYCTSRFYNARATPAPTQRSRKYGKSVIKGNVCKICSKKFHHICHLKRHRKLHNTKQNIQVEQQKPIASKRLIQYAENKCAICAKEFFKRSEFMNHAKQFHPNQKVFKCQHCVAQFGNIHSVGRHAKENHKIITKKKFLYIDNKCAICNMEFDIRTAFVEHAKRVHPNEKPFKCSECNSLFAQVGTIHLHFRRVHKKDIICKFCFKSFSSKTGLKIHLLQHTGQPVFSCSWCEKSYKHEFYLKIHMKKAHGNIIKLCKRVSDSRMRKLLQTDNKCGVCYKTFKFQRDLIGHVQLYHRNAKAFKCRTCNKRFYNPQARKNNRNSSKKYICERCPKKFDHICQWKHHLKQHTAKKNGSRELEWLYIGKYECGICYEKFTMQKDLMQHAKQFHPHEKAFKCGECNARFHCQMSVGRHVKRVHTNEILCKFCSKSFAFTAELETHLRMHTGERPFSCSVCYVTFTQKIYLKNHQKQHHSSEEVSRGSILQTHQPTLEGNNIPKIKEEQNSDSETYNPDGSEIINVVEISKTEII